MNPQACFVSKIVEVIRSGGVVALPTGFGCVITRALGSETGVDLTRQVRKLDEKHNLSLLCHSLAQLGELILVDNPQPRTIRALTSGIYIPILPGTREVSRMTLNKEKHAIGVRIPDHVTVQTIVEALGEPPLYSTLILPGEEPPLTNGYEVDKAIGRLVDPVTIGPVGRDETTMVIDFTGGSGVIAKRRAGDTPPFE